jgi:hypothetical protein
MLGMPLGRRANSLRPQLNVSFGSLINLKQTIDKQPLATRRGVEALGWGQ